MAKAETGGPREPPGLRSPSPPLLQPPRLPPIPMLILPSIAGDTCGSARIGAQYRSKCSAFARFLVICQNRGAIPNMPYDAMVELPAYIGKNGPEVISRDNIPLFQQGLMMQQLNSEKLVVEACIEGSYEKALKAFTLNKTVPSMTVAKEILDDMIEANKDFWPELK